MGPVYLDGTPFNEKNDALVTELSVTLISDYTITDHYDIFEIGMRNTLAEFLKPKFNSNICTRYSRTWDR